MPAYVILRLDRWPPRDRPGVVAAPQVVCPPDAEPAELDLQFLSGLDVQICYWPTASAPERLRAITRQALQNNPRRLWVLNVERGRWRLVKSVERGIEVAV
ncbi:hypothetical protein C8261_08750 [Pseudothauera lacus]|uniref:Uncharacterized protein n=2 Tax=Pseudothauera lacus TaxID=2136175 RepID=A0A2T4IF64_9RHOO|nr:hypothetical protein C8261_08750 [Pseudothauera lacus]